MKKKCPRCKLPSSGNYECEHCGLNFAEYKHGKFSKNLNLKSIDEKKSNRQNTIVFLITICGIIGFSYVYCQHETEKKSIEIQKSRNEAVKKQKKEWEKQRAKKEREKQLKAKREQREAALKARSPEEIRQDKIKKQFSAWDGSHTNLERFIKKNMNDPNSYDHAETVYWDRGDYLIVKTTFRGKNAFGALVINWVKAKIDLDGNVVQIIEQGR